MRKTLLMIAVPVALVGVGTTVAVARHRTQPNDAFSADLQTAQAAGLELAQAQTSNKYALTEVAPQSKPQAQKSLTRSAGNKTIRSKAPTLKAAPEPTQADAVEQEQTQSTQPAPAPAQTETPAPTAAGASPDPAPVPQDQGPILAGGSGRGRTGTSGGGGGWGEILGSILRGGTVDGDNCDPRGGARRPTRGGGTIYTPSPTGMGTGRTGTIFGSPTGSRPRR